MFAYVIVSLRIYDSEFKVKCEIDEYLNNSTYMRSFFDNLVIICENQIVTTSINSFDEKLLIIDYCYLHTILLVITCLLSDDNHCYYLLLYKTSVRNKTYKKLYYRTSNDII